MKNLGTNVQTYIDYYYEKLKDYKVISSNKMEGGDVTRRQRIEVYLTLGLIEPITEEYFSQKNHISHAYYINNNIEDEEIISNLLTKFDQYNKYKASKDSVHNEFFMYKEEEELVEAIMIASLYYNDDYKDDILAYFKNDTIDIDIIKLYRNKWIKDIRLVNKAAKYILNHVKKADREKIYAEVPAYQQNIPTSKKCQISSETKSYKGVLDFFKREGHEFKIPVYQRDYVWTKDNILNLFESIKSNKIVNLSSIVLHKKEITHTESGYTIVDGQQRITSLFITLRVIYDYLDEKIELLIGLNDTKSINEYISLHRFIETNYFMKENNSVVVLRNFKRVDGDLSYRAFSKVMSGEPDSTIVSNNIYMNYRYLKNHFSSNISTFEQINEIFNNLLQSVYITLSFDSITNEMELFEILNTSAIKLNTLDLMKSYLLSLIKQEELEKSEAVLQKEFHSKIFGLLKNNENKIEKFIRVYLRFVNQNFDKKNSLFVNFKNHHKKDAESLTKLELDEMIDDISVNLYRYLMAIGEQGLPKTLFIGDFIGTLDREIYSPVIMYYIKMHSENGMSSNDIRECLFEFERFEIILQICNYRGQSLSDNIDRIMKKVKDRDIREPKLLAEIMDEETIIHNTINVKVGNFKDKIREFRFTEKIAKKVLIRMSNYMHNNCQIKLNDNDNLILLNSPTAEHLLPKKANKWLENKMVNENEYLTCHELLGNFLLLEQKLNSSISNNIFSEKIDTISKFTHIMQDKTIVNYDGVNILELEKWTAKDIKNRNMYLSDLACKIWFN